MVQFSFNTAQEFSQMLMKKKRIGHLSLKVDSPVSALCVKRCRSLRTLSHENFTCFGGGVVVRN